MANYKALALAGMASVALSGCSWLGLGGNAQTGSQGLYADAHGGQYGYAPGQAYGGQAYGGQAYGQQAYAGGASNCQVPSAKHPVPAGCDPAAVTIGVGGFAQQPSFGAVGSPAFASSGYGSATGDLAHAPIAAREASLRKPKLRGFLQTGIEKSISGTYLDYDSFPGIDPAVTYVPADFAEGSIATVPNGTDTTIYSAVVEKVNQPTLSNDDVHSTPATVAGGLEYILTPSTTVFGSAGYTFSEGNSGDIVTIDGGLTRSVTQQRFDAAGNEISNITNTTIIPNVEGIASYAVDTSDMRRIDLEAGARHYFSPFETMPGLTPFVGAAAGASHYNRQALNFTQRQAFLEASYTAGEVGDRTYEVTSNPAALGRVDVYGSQWVPSGQLNAGLEWQATPSTAIAFESGVRVKGGRKYTNGVREGSDVSIPLTIRGSYNF